MSSIIITGTQVAYYNVCYRKLWLFTKNISMEHTSELVEIGKLIHELSYSRKKKEIRVDGITVDLLESKKGVIHEIKKSRALDQSHIWQLKYYLYYFKNIGLEMEGLLDYPKLKKRERILLTEEDYKKMEQILKDIEKWISETVPPKVINKPYCKKCSYYEFCYC
ncbi:MAG TPA: CRISPR-associated protein Cas4 [Exilispira sp.]|nr:CRISPR-associated protein Cas4 [Exilispira sp.]